MRGKALFKKMLLLALGLLIASLSACLWQQREQDPGTLPLDPVVKQTEPSLPSGHKSLATVAGSSEAQSAEASPEALKAQRILSRFKTELAESGKGRLAPYRVVGKYEGRLVADQAVYAEYRKLVTDEMIKADRIAKEPAEVFPFVVIYYISLKDSQDVLGQVLRARQNKDDEVTESYLKTLAEDPADEGAIAILIEQGEPGTDYLKKVLVHLRNKPKALEKSRDLLETRIRELESQGGRDNAKLAKAYAKAIQTLSQE